VYFGPYFTTSVHIVYMNSPTTVYVVVLSCVLLCLLDQERIKQLQTGIVQLLEKISRVGTADRICVLEKFIICAQVFLFVVGLCSAHLLTGSHINKCVKNE